MFTKTSPLDIRLSPVHDELQRLPARWTRIAGMPVAIQFGDPDAERSVAEHLGLCDVSWRSCITLKGAGAADFLESQKLPVPKEIMNVEGTQHGGIVARTGTREFFIEDSISGNTIPQLLSELDANEPNCIPVLRQDASFMISGKLAQKVLQQTCSYDFRQPHGRMVMTQMAGVSCCILHRFIQSTSAFQLWIDGTFGNYLWNALHEIVSDLGGAIIGAAAIYPEIAAH